MRRKRAYLEVTTDVGQERSADPRLKGFGRIELRAVEAFPQFRIDPNHDPTSGQLGKGPRAGVAVQLAVLASSPFRHVALGT